MVSDIISGLGKPRLNRPRVYCPRTKAPKTAFGYSTKPMHMAEKTSPQIIGRKPQPPVVNSQADTIDSPRQLVS
jgi:hypothetical protein